MRSPVASFPSSEIGSGWNQIVILSLAELSVQNFKGTSSIESMHD